MGELVENPQVNLEYFGRKIKEKFKTQKEFNEVLGENQSKVSRWLSGKRIISNEEMLKILMALNLTSDEENVLLRKELKIDFRTKNENMVEEITEKRCEVISRYFLSSPILPNYDLGEERSYSNIEACVKGIKGIISGSEDSLDFDFGTAYKNLMNYGINVFVLPFDKMNILIPQDSKRTELAFTVQSFNRKIIFLDADRTPTALLFDLVHELAHIFYKPSVKRSYDELEDDCDKIAEAVIYDKRKVMQFIKKVVGFVTGLLEEKEKITKEDLSKKIKNYLQTTIAAEVLAWDMEGFFKALENYGFFEKNNKTNKDVYEELMKVHEAIVQNYRDKIPKPFDDYNNNFNSVKNFFENIPSSSQFFLSFLIIKYDICNGNIGYRFLSDLLNINLGDADELIKVLQCE